MPSTINILVKLKSLGTTSIKQDGFNVMDFLELSSPDCKNGVPVVNGNNNGLLGFCTPATINDQIIWSAECEDSNCELKLQKIQKHGNGSDVFKGSPQADASTNTITTTITDDNNGDEEHYSIIFDLHQLFLNRLESVSNISVDPIIRVLAKP